MKKIIFVLGFLMTATICVEGHNHYNRHATISLQVFYDELSPFGEWINTADYGYAWRPYENDQADFRPYSSGGNWVYTDLGWTWVSDYRWGWAAFHYGRWYFDDYLGWMWIPGNEWAPAWVTWGAYDDLWAWAPMGPNVQVNVIISWRAPRSWWTFVPRHHFCDNNWYAYRYNRPVQINNITCITNIYHGNGYQNRTGNWFHGPRVRDVERHSDKRVRTMQLVDTDRPGNLSTRNDRVSVYRPGVTTNREDLRPARYRNVENQRTVQNKQRTTDFSTNRWSKSESTKRTVTQNTKLNRTEPARESTNRREIDRNSVKRDQGNKTTGNRTSTKPATETGKARSASPQRTGNN